MSHYAVNRFLEPFMRSVRQCMTGTETTLGQDCGTESMLCQYLHRALSSTCVNFNAPLLTQIATLMQDL